MGIKKARTVNLVAIASVIPLLDAKPSRTQVCIRGVGCINESGRPGMTMRAYNIYLKNRTRYPIGACVEYHSKYNRATADSGGINWSNGGWNVVPGKKVFAIDDASGKYAYFSADGVDGSRLRWERKQVDMGGTCTRSG
jgi:hypothetical protein